MPDRIKTDKTEATPVPAPNPREAHMALLRQRGGRLCMTCHGVGLVRSVEGQPRTECATCHGTGGVPMAQGEREAFVPPIRTPGGRIVTPGWERDARHTARCYRYTVGTRSGDDMVIKTAADAQIDAAAAQGPEALRELATVAR